MTEPRVTFLRGRESVNVAGQRALAGDYAPGLAAIAPRGRVATCEAAIVGGADTALGVFLRLPGPGRQLLGEDVARRF